MPHVSNHVKSNRNCMKIYKIVTIDTECNTVDKLIEIGSGKGPLLIF